MKIAHLGHFALFFGVLCGGGCGNEPFAYVRTSGKVCYEDGTPIPFNDIVLTFLSETPPKDAKTYPRPGMAIVDAHTGAFPYVTTHKHGDGLIVGKHKVLLTTKAGTPLPASIVPPIYADSEKTPLAADTDHLPLDLRVRKP